MFKYVLSVIDIFSRFSWLVPLESKSSSHVVRVLQPIYDQHGSPDRLQSDRGTEFEGKLRSMCKNYKIKMIKSRPYHLQSQRNFERSHRSLRKKIMYCFINLGKKGVNWASNLTLTNEVKNNWDGKVHLRFTLVKKSNILVKASLENVADLNDCIIKAPKRKDYRRHFRNVKKLEREKEPSYTAKE